MSEDQTTSEPNPVLAQVAEQCKDKAPQRGLGAAIEVEKEEQARIEKTIKRHMLQKELEKRFTYHSPKGDQPERYGKLRAKAKEFAELIADLCPMSREQSLALTHLEDSAFWANASIARNE